MTVSELIAALSRFDPNMRVVVAGFDESGHEGPGSPYIVETEDGEEAVMIDFSPEPVSEDLFQDLVWLDRKISRIEEIVSKRCLEGRPLGDDQISSIKLQLAGLQQERPALAQKIKERREYAYKLEAKEPADDSKSGIEVTVYPR